jgi:hypothetical protein
VSTSRREDDREDELPAPVRQELDALMARHRDDPPLAVLRAASADALPEPLQTAASAALDGSAWNRALVAGADAADAELDAAATDRLLARIHQQAGSAGASRTRRRLSTWQPLLGLAAAAILVTTVVYLRQSGPAVTPTGTPPAVPGASPAVPAFRLPLEAPAVKLTTSALVVRSAGSRGTFADDAGAAFDAYRAGDYRTAASEFARLEPRYPSSVEVPFYLGVSRLFLDDAPGAVTSLAAARRIADDTFRADIGWYLAVADERVGDITGARLELDTLCRGQSAYATRACDAAAKFPPG